MNKPDKVYLDNTNLLLALAATNANEGNIRETFFANQMSVSYLLNTSVQGDFLVNDKYIFEIGGKNKSFNQIKDLENAFLAIADIETGHGNRIPLWLFGFLY